MIISVAAEKAFNKIQHAFFIKILSKLRIVRNFLKLIINEKSTADIHNDGTLNALSLRLGTRQNARSQGFHPHAQKLEPAGSQEETATRLESRKKNVFIQGQCDLACRQSDGPKKSY